MSEWESTSIGSERLLQLFLGQNGEIHGRHREVEWENEGIRGRLKADHRVQWNQGWDEQTNYLRVTANNENCAHNQFNSQGKIDFAFHPSNLRRRLPFCGGIRQFWTTKQKQPESLFAQSNRETDSTKAVDDISKKLEKKQDNCTTKDQQFCDITSFHPSGLIILCLTSVFHCHLWAFLLASG